jgi:hypothetical protein
MFAAESITAGRTMRYLNATCKLTVSGAQDLKSEVRAVYAQLTGCTCPTEFLSYGEDDRSSGGDLDSSHEAMLQHFFVGFRHGKIGERRK